MAVFRHAQIAGRDALHLAVLAEHDVGGGKAGIDLDAQTFGLLRCLCEFATGTILCALWLRWKGRREVPLLTASAAAAGVALWAAGVAETAIVPVTFAALLLTLALADRHNPLGRRWPHYLGEISYATYLSHFLLFVVFKLAFVTDPRAIPPGLVALYLGLVLAASILLYHAVERPAQRWVMRWPQMRAPRLEGARTG